MFMRLHGRRNQTGQEQERYGKYENPGAALGGSVQSAIADPFSAGTALGRRHSRWRTLRRNYPAGSLCISGIKEIKHCRP